MGSLIHPELGLDCRFSSKPCAQKPIVRFIADVSKNHNASEKISKLDDYVNRLEDEMKKIDAFKRELPLCMLLLSDAIVAVQEELAHCKRLNSEPVLEEFIPLKKNCTDDKVEDIKEDISTRDKKNWMSSVQLWNSDDHDSHSNTTDNSYKKLSLHTDNNRKKRMGEEISRAVMDDLFQSGKNRASLPFKRGPNFPVMVVEKEDMGESPVAGLSLCTPGIKYSREVINPIGSSYSISGSSPANSSVQANFKSAQLQTSRKQRRCWSTELHHQFVLALHQLGGPQAATPKQIREHMQVDGLTNDEVKSHLQKFRLHMRRVATNSTSTSQPSGAWTSQDFFAESLKQQCSPEGPLQLSRCTDGIEDEDDE